jgi:hypothetical protein
MTTPIDAAGIVAAITSPLVWVPYGADAFGVKTIVGYYRIDERGGLWKVVIQCLDTAHFVAETDTPEAAQAAADADYRARIAAALDFGKVVALVEAGQSVLDAMHARLNSGIRTPVKYGAPFGELNGLTAALAALMAMEGR